MRSDDRTHTRIANGLANPERARARRRLRSLASTWRESETLERLLALKASNPSEFYALPTNLRMSVATYSEGKAAAAELQAQGGN